MTRLQPHLWRDWIAANTIGEIVGLALAVILGVGVAESEILPPALQILIIIAACALIGPYEGSVVGWSQWFVLRRELPSLGWESWTGATAAGATAAWILGGIPTFVLSRRGGFVSGPRPEIVLLLSVIAGCALGAILGAAQWFVLRRYVRHAKVWIAANAVAWGIGMPIIFFGAGLASPQTPALQIGVLAFVSVTAAGAAIGAVEGWFLRRLV